MLGYIQESGHTAETYSMGETPFSRIAADSHPNSTPGSDIISLGDRTLMSRQVWTLYNVGTR